MIPIPDATPEEIERGRKLFAGECAFFHGSQVLADLPETCVPEVAFAGRSNVGKSSLINALTGRTALARSSSEPGRTRQLNFFDLNGSLILVDMPGYGFARASKAVKEDWQATMFGFLRGRQGLKRVVVLVDCRIGMKSSDLDMCNLLDKSAVSYQVVLTKADEWNSEALAERRKEIGAEMARHAAAYPKVLAVSSRTGAGIAELRAMLAEFAV